MAASTLSLTRRMVVALAILLFALAVLLFLLGLQLGSRYFSATPVPQADAVESGLPATRGAP